MAALNGRVDMSFSRQVSARTEFTTKIAALLRLNEESANELAELIEDFVTNTVLDKHESNYYHNSRP